MKGNIYPSHETHEYSNKAWHTRKPVPIQSFGCIITNNGCLQFRKERARTKSKETLPCSMPQFINKVDDSKVSFVYAGKWSTYVRVSPETSHSVHPNVKCLIAIHRTSDQNFRANRWSRLLTAISGIMGHCRGLAVVDSSDELSTSSPISSSIALFKN